jgi:hypothetical protein
MAHPKKLLLGFAVVQKVFNGNQMVHLHVNASTLKLAFTYDIEEDDRDGDCKPKTVGF